MTDTPGQKPSRLETRALLQEISRQTHLPEDVVRLVMDTFTSVMQQALVQGEMIVVRHFGTYHAKKTRRGGFDGVYVQFLPAAELKKALQEATRPMEKYGVEMKNEAVLLAQVTGECPACKTKLESTSPPKCSTCGTEPFENKETK